MENFVKLELTSGNIGKETLENNRDNIRCFPYEEGMEQDGFLHLLAAGSFFLTSTCSFIFTSLKSYYLICPYEGIFEVTCGDSTLLGQPEHLLFLSPDSKLHFHIKSGLCRFFIGAFTGAALAAYRKMLPDDISHVKARAGASCVTDSIECLQHHIPGQFKTDTLIYSKWINDIFTELCVYQLDYTRLREQIPSYMLEMKKLFDEEYQRSYSLKNLEEYFDKSRYRLCREFTHYFGMPPIQYLNKQRMAAARELLLSTSMAVHEVGSAVGIDNTNHFINLFKKETGTTPLVFKQEAPVAISELHYPYTPDARQP